MDVTFPLVVLGLLCLFGATAIGHARGWAWIDAFLYGLLGPIGLLLMAFLPAPAGGSSRRAACPTWCAACPTWDAQHEVSTM